MVTNPVAGDTWAGGEDELLPGDDESWRLNDEDDLDEDDELEDDDSDDDVASDEASVF